MKAVSTTNTFDLISKVLFITLLFSLINIATTNARSILDVPVTIDVVKGSTDGVSVSIIRNGIPTATIDAKRKMNLQLEFNKNYTLIFKKHNYISKSVEFDTHVSAARINDGFEPYGIGVKLYQQDEENTVAYNQPVAHIAFDKSLDEFTYQTDYSKSILSNMEETASTEETTTEESAASTMNTLSESNNTNSQEQYKPAASEISTNDDITGKAVTAYNEKGGNVTENTIGVAGNDATIPQHAFEKIHVVRDEYKSGNMIVTLTRVTKGNVTNEYRKVRYAWGGTYFFLNNSSSISEDIYSLHTNVKVSE